MTTKMQRMGVKINRFVNKQKSIRGDATVNKLQFKPKARKK